MTIGSIGLGLSGGQKISPTAPATEVVDPEGATAEELSQLVTTTRERDVPSGDGILHTLGVGGLVEEVRDDARAGACRGCTDDSAGTETTGADGGGQAPAVGADLEGTREGSDVGIMDKLLGAFSFRNLGGALADFDFRAAIAELGELPVAGWVAFVALIAAASWAFGEWDPLG